MEEGGYEERTFRFGEHIAATVRLLAEFKGKQFDAKQQGLFLWPGAERFCQYAADNPHLFAGKRVIELGAGSGLGSAVVAQVNPKELMVTDGSEQVMDLLRRNVNENLERWQNQRQSSNGIEGFIRPQIQIFQLQWNEDEEAVKKARDSEGNELYKSFDVVFGSDLIYEYANIVRLLTTAKALLADNEHAFFVLAYVHRSDYLWNETLRHATELGLTHEIESEGAAGGGLPSRILIFRKTTSHNQLQPINQS